MRKPRLRDHLAHLYFRWSRPMTLGVRAVLFSEDGRKVCLVRHTYVSGWHLPGGGVDVGETLEQAVIREVLEETGMALTGSPALLGVYHNTFVTRRDHVALFVVRDCVPVLSRVPDREIAEAGFFDVDALPDGTTPATLRRLAEIRGTAVVSAVW
jgi:ADP-ribose pyrophosphatase YjhB (NUDIX family)